MNIGGYQLTVSTIVLFAIAALWLLALLAGILSSEKGRGRVRKTDVIVLIVSVIAAAAWMFMLTPAAAATPAEVAQRKATASCAVIQAGDNEAKVKARLGDPDEIRGEEELRGPATNVWIYRDSRCAVHFFGDRVESIE